MSLPLQYSEILNQLNKAVLRQQPDDYWQFCANWFNSKLEEQRIHSRNPTRAPLRKKSSMSMGFAAASPYTFGGPPPPVPEAQVATPTRNHEATFTNSFAPQSSSGIAWTKPFGDNDTQMRNLDSKDEDSEGEAADTLQALPGSGPVSPVGIPLAYNLGRRSSVSAESLDPSAMGGHKAPITKIPKTPEQRSRIETSIKGNLLFRSLDEDQYADVLNAMKEVRVSKGTEVVKQGAVGDYFYIVESGEFQVFIKPGAAQDEAAEAKMVAEIKAGGSFGELALMYNAPRAATVTSTSPDSTLWALDRVTFRSILMVHTSRKRKMYESFLSSVPLLVSLEPHERAKIADALEERVYEEDEDVVKEGEIGKQFYLIIDGKANVYKNRGVDEHVGSLTKGDYFGELALLNSAPRAATVRPAPGGGRLRVATLGEKAFTRLLGPVVDILQRRANSYNAPK